MAYPSFWTNLVKLKDLTSEDVTSIEDTDYILVQRDTDHGTETYGITGAQLKANLNVPASIDDLSDVDLTVEPEIGQVLTWNGSAWVADDVSA